MTKSLRRAHILIGGALLLLCGCARAHTQAPDGVAEPARRAATLRIQPGDRIAVIILREPELTDTVTVNERGEAAFAKLGMLQVSLLTMSELQDTLRTMYGRVLRNPAIEIGVLRRVAVNGEVRSPNVYMVDVSTTLRDVIAKAGGLTDNGNREKVEIVRDGQRIRVSQWDREQGTTSDLRSGDQVFVGRKSWWSINALPAISTAAGVTAIIVSLTR